MLTMVQRLREIRMSWGIRYGFCADDLQIVEKDTDQVLGCHIIGECLSFHCVSSAADMWQDPTQAR